VAVYLVLAYVGQAKSAGESEADFGAFYEMLLPVAAALTGAITYETIATIPKENEQNELAEWLDERIRAGVAARGRQPVDPSLCLCRNGNYWPAELP
jgi:hypothetical protein